MDENGLTVTKADRAGGAPPDGDGSGARLLDRLRPQRDTDDRYGPPGPGTGGLVNLDPIGPRGRGRLAGGAVRFGVQFAAHDHLSLSTHPAVTEAAHTAIGQRGVHAAGSAGNMGLSDLTLDLEQRLARFLNVTDATVFPTQWDAVAAILRALVGQSDHVVLCRSAPAGLQALVAAATARVHYIADLSTRILASCLDRIHTQEPDAGILVVTESLSPWRQTVPDLRAIQDLCRRTGATLLVDVTPDLGAIGPGGAGTVGEQGMLGQIDIIVGGFCRSFASNGGFAAANQPALKSALKRESGVHMHSGALSPIQLSVVLAALDIIQSDEGQSLRDQLMRNADQIRRGFQDIPMTVVGNCGPVIPVRLGNLARARQMTAAMIDRGVFVSPARYPDADCDDCLWCIQVMAAHTIADIDHLLIQAAEVLALFPD